ncbi:hypothetical protein E3T37_03525 [Cryobacterium sp. TMT2-10]|uniref:hypothetical protein n=1 Tax=Cryobacterium sp. TMT2-10 TaxID=1259244 RepID=UPI00110057AA|nr:hypothetical protein [Cryobacterium sp. TMT2-10]TFD41735.1 hypothetical protein E3T37_03525 [Cryobacterium sp. TMT2-10]
MTEVPAPVRTTKAKQLAEVLGIELLPWQVAVLDAYLTTGQRMMYMGGRQSGRSTVRALAGLADALRNPPVTGAPERAALRGVVGGVQCNASNYPDRVAPRTLGQDMGPLIDRTTDAILADGYRREPLARAWYAGYEAGSADESFSARGLSSDPDAAEHPHANPYAAVTPSTEES